MNKSVLMISNGFIAIPGTNTSVSVLKDNIAALGTVISNLAYFGYVPSIEALRALENLTTGELGHFWKEVEPSFKEVTGANRNMDRFVVYKNFPKEVLEMSVGRYWLAQILMYWGLPNELFTQEEQPRPVLTEDRKLKVLSLANETTEFDIFRNLVKNKARWTDPQKEWMEYLFTALRIDELFVDAFSFKENGIWLAGKAMEIGVPIVIAVATDVLRLAAAISGGDISLRENVKFKNFKRSERQQLLTMLIGCKNLEDDVYARPQVWKKLLHALRPGDYKKFSRVSAAYNNLYNGSYITYASLVEAGLRNKDIAVLATLATRPGDFVRRFHKTYALFGAASVEAFVAVIPSLTTSQLLKIDRYLITINDRTQLVYAPRGNWTRAQFATNSKKFISIPHRDAVRTAISTVIRTRLGEKCPDGFNLDLNTDLVKLQTNDQKLASYGRGTAFPIPDEVTFLRSASYWEHPTTDGNVWYDNGWNFFDTNWNSLGACSWTDTIRQGAIFSGDPANSKDLKGRGCQMIDLYPAKLLKAGIRYAVWNILCYSKQSFNQSEDVLATLQWGVDAEKGNLFEPSRAQMVFPVKGDNFTKYIAYIDLVTRKLIYVDANLKGDVCSAGYNGKVLEKAFPAFVEYLNSLPSVADLFSHGAEGSTPILYTDEGLDIDGGKALVFNKTNAANNYVSLDLNTFLE